MPAVVGLGALMAVASSAFQYTGGKLSGYDRDPNVDEYERKEAMRANRRRPITETISELGEGRGETWSTIAFDSSLQTDTWTRKESTVQDTRSDARSGSRRATASTCQAKRFDECWGGGSFSVEWHRAPIDASWTGPVSSVNTFHCVINISLTRLSSSPCFLTLVVLYRAIGRRSPRLLSFNVHRSHYFVVLLLSVKMGSQTNLSLDDFPQTPAGFYDWFTASQAGTLFSSAHRMLLTN